MLHIFLITGLLTLTPSTLNAWEWPIWLLTSCIGPWFMNADQMYFYKTVRAFKEHEEKPYTTTDRKQYFMTLKALAVPIDTKEAKENSTFLKIRYATYGYLYKMAQFLSQKSPNSSYKDIQHFNKSILKKDHNSKEYIYFGRGKPPFDFLPDRIKEKYEKKTNALACEIADLDNAQVHLKRHGISYAPLNDCLQEQWSILDGLRAEREAQEDEEFAKLKRAYVHKAYAMEKKYPALNPKEQIQKLCQYFLDKALSYKMAREKLSSNIEAYNRVVQKNQQFYQALLQKYTISLA